MPTSIPYALLVIILSLTVPPVAPERTMPPSPLLALVPEFSTVKFLNVTLLAVIVTTTPVFVPSIKVVVLSVPTRLIFFVIMMFSLYVPAVT
jgi:hypothetical protein